MNKVCFVVEESLYYNGKYIIVPKYDNFYLESTTGSFNIICARLFEMTYAQYLRMCRDMFGADIIGRNCLYPVAYFSDKIIVNRLCKLLNARANYILWMRENKEDYAKKEKYIQDIERQHKILIEAHENGNIKR